MAETTLTVRAIAEMIGAAVEGDDSVEIADLGAIETAGPGELTFAVDEKRAALLAGSRASAAIVAEKIPAPMSLLVVEDVQRALAKLLEVLAGEKDRPAPGVHASAVIAPDAEVPEDVAVGPGVTIGEKVRIGPGSALCANVTVGDNVVIGSQVLLAEGAVVRHGSRIGDRVRIGPNTVIGWDGFGYFLADGVHHRFAHIGNVVIEDDVDMGACCCVDRAKFGSTRIGAGTKLDNLVQVAHNVQIGRGCLLVGQCGIAGSAKLGNYVVVGGNAGIRDNITLGDGVQCSAFAAVAQDVADGQVVAGIPAGPAKKQFRIFKASEKLPELLKRVRDLESRLDALQRAKDD